MVSDIFSFLCWKVYSCWYSLWYILSSLFKGVFLLIPSLIYSLLSIHRRILVDTGSDIFSFLYLKAYSCSYRLWYILFSLLKGVFVLIRSLIYSLFSIQRCILVDTVPDIFSFLYLKAYSCWYGLWYILFSLFKGVFLLIPSLIYCIFSIQRRILVDTVSDMFSFLYSKVYSCWYGLWYILFSLIKGVFLMIRALIYSLFSNQRCILDDTVSDIFSFLWSKAYSCWYRLW